MLWSKVDQTAAARQAVTTVETEKLRGQSRGIQRTWPGRTWSVLIEFSCRISWMTCRVSAFGSYASASVHRLCPGRTSTLVIVPSPGTELKRGSFGSVVMTPDCVTAPPARSVRRPPVDVVAFSAPRAIMPRIGAGTSRDGVNGKRRMCTGLGGVRVHHKASGSRWRYLPRFLFQSIRAARQAKRAPGSLAVSVPRDADRAFWTRIVWRDEAAMRSLMQSGVHRRIMARLPEWCDEAALAHWVQDANEPPTWPEAYRRLQQMGRRSRVSHPSEAQSRFEIREPRIFRRSSSPSASKTMISSSLEGVTTVHHGHMGEINIESETSAKGVWALEDMLHYSAGAPVAGFRGYGHYHESYVCEDGEWRSRSSIQVCVTFGGGE